MKKEYNIFEKTIMYVLLSAFGIFMIYPLIWLFLSSFKPNNEIFGSVDLLPKNVVWDAFYNGWKGSGQFSFGVFFVNTFELVIPVVVFTLISSTLVAYGFARFKFPLKKILFTLMISTLMLPNAVIIIPRYILFKNFDWLNSYLPFTIPALFACYPFFIFMLVQFFRGLPRDLDESATIDGCNSFTILVRILLPLCKPALFSAGIFQFIWTWNDFFNSMIYINSVKKYTVALGLRMSLDTTTAANWNEIMAMSVIAIIPCVLIFFFAQKYFVEGIATTGIKG
ncbi:carbohydrate ABC transporter permease [Ruminiclostridium cellobioparum]|uniref:ABC-type sugar transport system, permease component n=1 Tax=Ruminiclostridium cellobioparum subsp. termitidis CT1112 TaxID=1195236 RepID=S0FK77_RUMCE|nr:carbohydrate ABC transporter permease [Ruminiclostridium cellobioparum]EMS70726.1 ABC-type sugar transport system, permease component [Ruminiclostridium cellobioparum subsp. termitidis CT1112]